MAKAKSYTVNTGNDNSYIVTHVEDDQWRVAAKSDPDYPLFTISAPADAGKDEITGEVDYYELCDDGDEVPATDDMFEDELESSYY